MRILFSKTPPAPTGTLVVGVKEGKVLTPEAQEINSRLQNTLETAMEYADFKGKFGESLSLPCPHGLGYNRLILMGLGTPENLEGNGIVDLGGKIYSSIISWPAQTVSVHLSDVDTASVAFGSLLRSWHFEKYKTKKKNENVAALETLTFITSYPDKALENYRTFESIAEGVFLTRLTASEPPNVLNPESMVDVAKELKHLGVGIDVLDEKHMKKLGMNALLGVGQGSNYESHLIILTWNGGSKGEAPVAIVGKGVTFDTGGISIKPAANMDEMKCDMAGSGVVLGLMKALAGRKAKVNVVGIMGMVENMPSGTAQRPGDIVTSLSGQTIEILNTDAEGRLVLADALWYTQEKYKPKVMINLATLTGAMIVALGHEMAGIFSNTDSLAQNLIKSGEAVGEHLWHLPLSKIGEGYDKDIDTPAADVKNVGSNRGAGSITAAQFLQRFVNNVPWAHLDIAGVVWENTRPKPVAAKGATGYGVRLLDHYIKTHHEH